MDANSPIRAEDVAKAILPEHGVYMIRQSENPPAEATLPNALGATGRNMDVVLEDYLRATGRWAGRQLAIYINDEAIAQLALENAEAAAKSALQLQNELTIATVAHEIGHGVDRGIDTSQPTAGYRKFVGKLAAYQASGGTAADLFPSEPPFFGHACQWVRCTLHAWYRAKQAGYECPVEYLFNGDNYAIAQPERFLYALGMEPENMERVPLLDVPQYRMWEGFRRLWNVCVQRWVNEQDSAASVNAAMELVETRTRF